MRPMRKAALLIAILGLGALFPTTVLAAGEPPLGWPGWHLLSAGLSFLAPLALILLAVGATPPEEVGEMVGTALAALVVGLVAYVACGFAFEFGGLALQAGWPGLGGLSAEWSPIAPGAGPGWGLIGWRGFLLAGQAVTANAFALAAVQLPAVSVAVLIPALALARRIGRGPLIAIAALVGGLLYPLAGNWVWGGGWLQMLGRGAGLGHGFVDLGGSATLNLLGAGAALAGILVLGRRSPEEEPRVVELPPVHFPLFMLIGALFAPIGWLGLVLANPLLTPDIPAGLVAVNLVLAGLGGTAPGLFYSWLATGRLDALLAARGLLAGLVAAGACCGFMSPWAALLVGLLAGTALPLILYTVEHGLGWHDPNAILATHGVPGLLGILWLALFADGRWGVGWNGVSSPFGLAQQGVAGLFVASGYASDIPGQLWAQVVGLGAILAAGFLLPVLIFILARAAQALARRSRSRQRRRATAPFVRG